jgi:hypothetical protein
VAEPLAADGGRRASYRASNSSRLELRTSKNWNSAPFDCISRAASTIRGSSALRTASAVAREHLALSCSSSSSSRACNLRAAVVLRLSRSPARAALLAETNGNPRSNERPRVSPLVAVKRARVLLPLLLILLLLLLRFLCAHLLFARASLFAARRAHASRAHHHTRGFFFFLSSSSSSFLAQLPLASRTCDLRARAGFARSSSLAHTRARRTRGSCFARKRIISRTLLFASRTRTQSRARSTLSSVVFTCESTLLRAAQYTSRCKNIVDVLYCSCTHRWRSTRKKRRSWCYYSLVWRRDMRGSRWLCVHQ